MFVTEAGRLKEGSHKPAANRDVRVKSGRLREFAQLQNYKHKKYKKMFVYVLLYGCCDKCCNSNSVTGIKFK